MTLPNKLMAARLTNQSPADTIDDALGSAERAVCDIFGIPIDTSVSEAIITANGSGQITKLLRLTGDRQSGTTHSNTTNGLRIRDGAGTATQEIMFSQNANRLYAYRNMGTDAAPSWTVLNGYYDIVLERWIQCNPYCKVIANPSASISSGVLSTIDFGSAPENPWGMWSGGAASQVSMPQAGVYSFHLLIANPGASGGTYRLGLVRANGSTEIAWCNCNPIGSSTTYMAVSGLYYSAGTTGYFEVRVQHDIGSSQTFNVYFQTALVSDYP